MKAFLIDVLRLVVVPCIVSVITMQGIEWFRVRKEIREYRKGCNNVGQGGGK